MTTAEVRGSNTKADLYREYGRILDMIHDMSLHDMSLQATSLQAAPWTCVKLYGVTLSAPPVFTEDPTGYTFALTVFENQPLFDGDMLYQVNEIGYTPVKVTGVTDTGSIVGRTGPIVSDCIDGEWRPYKLTRTGPTQVENARESLVSSEALSISTHATSGFDTIDAANNITITWETEDGTCMSGRVIRYSTQEDARKTYTLLHKLLVETAAGYK